MTLNNVHILMVEDNPADVRLTREAFREWNIHPTLSVVKDGVEAMAFLRRQNEYSNSERPDLIFLDINLPRKNGLEVLAEIKQDEELKRIPIIILTTSSAHADILKSYNLHVNSYVVKPVDLDQFNRVIQNIDRFWMGTARLPP